MDETTPAEGHYGRASELTIKDVPEYAETVCGWLITAPLFHPAWSQYSLNVVRLRDGVPGFPPPHRQFPGATHELVVVALNPEHGPWEAADDLAAYSLKHGFPYLLPVNIIFQFEGTDDEGAELGMLAAKSVVHGYLNPETADAPERVRAGWKTAMVKTLAHIRGEEHAP